MTATAKPSAKVPPEVLSFWDGKGLKPAFSWVDVWQEEHKAAFTVAGIMERDMLSDMRDSVGKAIKEGQSFQKFKKQTRAVLKDNGWLARKSVTDPITGVKKDVELGKTHRLFTIFDTNVRTARSAGQWGRIQRTKDTLPNLEYRIGPSIKHRDEHVVFDRVILPANHPFWVTHFTPNGFGCKCSVRQISKFQTDKLGGVSADPVTPPVTWRNPRTGKKIQVPLGVDPGFAYNPGMDRMAGIRASVRDR